MTKLPPDAPAIVIPDLFEVVMDRRPVASPRPRQALVKTEFSGVSMGTEMWAANGQAEGWGPTPYVPGYQAVGRVVALGDDSSGSEIEVGDLVAAWGLGAHQRYFSAALTDIHPLGSSDHLDAAALWVQPSVGANALNEAEVECGDTVLVVGQGLVGQLTALQARMRGAYVIVSDVASERLELSRAHCADWAIDASKGLPSEQIWKRFPDGVDVVIEATGFNPLIRDAMSCARQRGRFVFVGQYWDGFDVDPGWPQGKQLKVSFPHSEELAPHVLRLITGGLLDVGSLITHRVDWREAADVYRRLPAERDRINGMVFDWRDAE